MNPPSSSSASSSPVRVRCRRDLIFVQTLHKHESAVVAKDPIALKYHRLRPDEYFVLRCLDGMTSLDQMRERYEKRFPPTRVTTVQLNQLLFRFHESGLTVSDAPKQGERLTDKRAKDRKQKLMQLISGVLFIRFPGVDPEPFLRRLYPLMRPFLGVIGSAVALILCLVSLTVFLANREQFIAELPQMSQWLSFDSLLILGAVIGGTKILHELGHAVMCKHFGGECHQIGPMLLVFTPALYCDTSDSWMLPSRWQRAAVGMAGIGTEIILASIATLIWVSSSDGISHTIAMNVMLVCGVSTVMFNANPLLRYDGYYVLSDLTDTPNLGEKAKKRLSATTLRWFAGVDESHEQTQDDGGMWLAVYAILATTYRWVLSFAILWIVSVMLRPYGLESIGRALGVFAAGGLLFMLFRPPYQFLKNPARRRYIQMKRVLVSVVLLAIVIGLCFVPISSNVSADGRIVPRMETPIYVSSPGELAELVREPGENVHKGDVIARLSNPATELEYLRSKGRYEQQNQLVETINRLLVSDPAAANELPAAEAMLAELKKQSETRKKRLDALQITAPCDGKLMAVARRPDHAPTDSADAEFRLVNWSGYPTDMENKECFLQSGDELMSIAEVEDWDAELILDQSQVRRIEIGSEVKLICEAVPSSVLTGQVVEISRTRWAMENDSQRQDDPRATKQIAPAATSYIVRVELPKSELTLATGTTVTCTINAGKLSIAGRVARILNGLFRFRE